MRLRVLMGGVVIVGVAALFTGWILSQDRRGPDRSGGVADRGGPSIEILEARTKAGKPVLSGKPGDHHTHLQPLVGTFNQLVKWGKHKDAPWDESKSTAEYQWIMGGRFLLQKVRGEMKKGERFEWLAILGYDNTTKQHTSIWVNSQGTGMLISEGTCDESGRKITLYGETADPKTDRTKNERSVLSIINNDQHVFEMYETGPDGKEFKALEITYTRK